MIMLRGECLPIESTYEWSFIGACAKMAKTIVCADISHRTQITLKYRWMFPFLVRGECLVYLNVVDQ